MSEFGAEAKSAITVPSTSAGTEEQQVYVSSTSSSCSEKSRNYAAPFMDPCRFPFSTETSQGCRRI